MAIFIEAYQPDEACLEAGLPEPIIEEKQDGIGVTFLTDIIKKAMLF